MMKCRKYVLVVCVTLALLFLGSTPTQAAGSKTVRLKAGKTYTYNLDGGKKKEKILVKTKKGKNGPSAQIYINNKLMVTDTWDDYGDTTKLLIDLIDINTKDKYKEIHIVQKHITQGEPFNNARIYRYSGGKMSLYGNVMNPGYEWTKLKSVQPGNGKIVYDTASTYEYPAGYYFEAEYKKSNGRMKLCSNRYNTSDKNKKTKYMVTKNRNVTKNIGKGKVVFKLKKGEKLSVLKVGSYKLKFYMYVKNSKGRKGWVSYNWDFTDEY